MKDAVIELITYAHNAYSDDCKNHARISYSALFSVDMFIHIKKIAKVVAHVNFCGYSKHRSLGCNVELLSLNLNTAKRMIDEHIGAQK